MDNRLMENNKRIYSALKGIGLDFAVYVPCTILKSVQELVSEDRSFKTVLCAREETGIGVIAGAYLGGKKTCAIMQSSGLGTCFNALASLLITYRIPTLILIAHRGLDNERIEAQKPLGRKLEELLHTLNIPCFTPASAEEIEGTIIEAQNCSLRALLPSAILFSEKMMRGDSG